MTQNLDLDLLRSFVAVADGVSADQVLQRILDKVAIPA